MTKHVKNSKKEPGLEPSQELENKGEWTAFPVEEAPLLQSSSEEEEANLEPLQVEESPSLESSPDSPSEDAALQQSPRPAAPSRRQRQRKVVVLSRNSRLYSTRRLVEAGEQQGCRVEVLDTLACSLVVDPVRPALLYAGRPVRGVDVVIPRIGASITDYGLAVVSHFELMDVPVLNSSTAVARSRDKLRCLQVMARAGLLVPRTVMARSGESVRALVNRVGGLPVIVKLTQGTQGVGVMIAHSMAEVSSMLDTMWELGQEVILQEFIADSKGRDVRVLVVGDQAVGAMRRQAKRGEFRSNLHRGGRGRAISLPPRYAQVAVTAARAVGLEVAGVDLLESKTGPLVMEVNSSPGLEGIEGALGQDIAGQMLSHALHYSKALRAGWQRRVGW